MTEAEWLECEEPRRMLAFLHRQASYRKFRLFACACCRRRWHLMTSEQSRRAVEVAERYADDLADPEELEEVFQAAAEEAEDLDNAATAAAYAAVWDDEQAAEEAADYAAYTVDDASENAVPSGSRWGPAGVAECAAQSEFIRCVFGNPFRAVAFDPAWRTTNVAELAQAIYDERAFDRLPILADALLDAGCDSEAILAHLRGPGPHVRGCWVVDLILGKE